MFDEPGRRGASGHSVGFVFHRESGLKDSDVAGFPGVRISRLGGRQRAVEDDDSFGRRGGWTSGFFPGELWLLYQATGSKYWLKEAQAWTAPLAPEASSVTRPDPTDIGFIIGTSFGNGYRLTGEPAYKEVLTTAGNSLEGLYNLTVGALRSWTFKPYEPPNFAVIIDSMMTLGPLQWGASNGGSSTWAGIAATHAQTVATNFVRLDGSTFEVAVFNQTTGALESRGTFAGYSDSSTWARGQAWALYGFRAGLSDVG